MTQNPNFAGTNFGTQTGATGPNAYQTDTAAAFQDPLHPQQPPSHQLHRDSDVLPGARGAAQQQQQPGMGRTDYLGRPHQGYAGDDQFVGSGVNAGHSAFTDKRPLDVQPTDQGKPCSRVLCARVC